MRGRSGKERFIFLVFSFWKLSRKMIESRVLRNCGVLLNLVEIGLIRKG